MTKYGNGAKPERKRRMKADIKEDFDESMLGYDEAYEDMLKMVTRMYIWMRSQMHLI